MECVLVTPEGTNSSLLRRRTAHSIAVTASELATVGRRNISPPKYRVKLSCYLSTTILSRAKPNATPINVSLSHQGPLSTISTYSTFAKSRLIGAQMAVDHCEDYQNLSICRRFRGTKSSIRDLTKT